MGATAAAIATNKSILRKEVMLKNRFPGLRIGFRSIRIASNRNPV
jgi:hypothetical protein